MTKSEYQFYTRKKCVAFRASLCLVVYCTLFLASVAPPARADDGNDGKVGHHTPSAEKQLKLIAVSSNNFPPINLINSDGRLDGFGRELSEAVAAAIGADLSRLHASRWSRVLEWLDNGEADFIHDVGYAKDREAYLEYSDPIFEMSESIFVRQRETRVNGFEDLKNVRVGCITGHITAIYLQKIPGFNCIYLPRPIDGVNALLSKDIDAFPFPEQVAIHMMREIDVLHMFKVVGEPVRDPLVWHMAAKRGNLKMVALLNRGLASVKASGEYDRIYDKWLSEKIYGNYSSREIQILVLVIFLALLSVAILTLAIFTIRGERNSKNSLLTMREDQEKIMNSLRESEMRLRDFTESASDWLWEMDSDFRFCYHSNKEDSENFLNQTGINLDFMIGKRRWDVVDPDLKTKNFQDHAADLYAHRSFRDFRYSMHTPGGKYVHLSINGIPIYDEEGNFDGYRGTGTNVTEKVVSEAAADKAKNTLLNAVEHVQDGLALFNSRDKLVLCNARFREIYSSIKDAVKPGLRYKDMVTGSIYAGMLNISKEEEDLWIARQNNIHKKSNGVLECQTSDGSWYLFKDSAMPDGSRVVLCSDITELKLRQEALIESQERERLILESTGEAIFGIDVYGNFTFCNPASLKLLGYKNTENLLGRNMHSIIQHSRVNGIPYRDNESLILKVLKGGTGVHADDEVFWRNGGTNFPAEYRAFPIVRSSELIGAVVTFSDITERKITQERLLHAQKMEAVGQLTGGIAHDFNNLLTVIIGNLRYIRDNEDQDNQNNNEVTAEAVDDALSAALDGEVLTSQLLSFSRKQSLSPQNLNLNILLDDFGNFVRRTLPENIEIKTFSYDKIPPIYIDRSQLESALLNLTLNARDAMPDGGDISISSSIIRCETAHSGTGGALGSGDDCVEICISDTGTGMPDDVRSRVLEPFFTTKGPGKGSGLGLSMVHGFVQQSGGNLEITSDVNVGSTISIIFPIQVNADNNDEPRESGPNLKAISKGGSEKILVVEDEPKVRKLAARILKNLGYQVLTAETAVKAKEMLSEENDIDLIFSDLIMPGGVSGYDLAKWAAENVPDIPILLTTGFSDEAKDIEGKIALLRKPYSQEQVVEHIRALLNGGEKEAVNG